MVTTVDLERFYLRTERQGSCLIWTGGKSGSKTKYPVFYPTGIQKQVYAHRWIYEQMVGPIPAGHEIDHVKTRGCVSRLCVEWTHLEAVTSTENWRRERMVTCTAGHDLSLDENCVWDRQGRRRGCLLCYREKNRIRMAAAYQRRRSD